MGRCYAYQNSTFQPAMRLIAAITNANPAVVTTTFAHSYLTGLIVRLDLPPAVGMPQANGMTGTITVLSPTTFSINIDTTSFTPFAIPGMPGPHTDICAQVVPIAEVNSSLVQAVQNIL
jgi:hypothetical protein